MKYSSLLLALLFSVSCSNDDATTGFILNGKAKTPSTTTAFLHKDIQKTLDFLNPLKSAFALVPTGSPATVQATFYKIYLSQNTDCSSPVLVTDYGTSGKTFELTRTPRLFTGNPGKGTYECVIIEMDDIAPFTPDATAVASWPTECVAGTTYYPDTYRAGSPTMNDINGVPVPATGDLTTHGIDKQTIFFSTNTTAVIGTGTAQAISDQVMPLSNALVLPGRSTFYIDLVNSIDNTHGKCWPNPSGIGFE